MRYLIDTNIFVYAAIEPDRLSRDVAAILSDYDNTIYLSIESVRELIIAYRNKKLSAKTWKSEADIINSIKNEYFIQILPVHEEHMQTYASLRLNEAMDHRDPSDHIIIAHAITEKLPLISSDHKFKFYRNQGLQLIMNE